MMDLCLIFLNVLYSSYTVKDSWIFFEQTFPGLGLGKLFPARESLVGDIPAGDGKNR